MIFSKALAAIVAEFEKLPGIGPKSAQRLALHFLRRPEEEVRRFAETLVEARSKIRFCRQCQAFSESDLCMICADPSRNPAQICVVADVRDVSALERLNEYKGLYHVLHGLLSPMDGVGPGDLKIRELMARLEGGAVEEVILATSPTVEGDATALYLAQVLKPLGIRTTRLAQGIAVGAELDYADQATLLSAFQYRREM
ncbi:MAG: recombination protein RecR [Armatimonadetes bacterium]|nr:MAG: recombination protein RecR [Armatimonadota bacterium]GIV02967.1 MAG: recombination protein RecR [Fimbriimonadales bacterium]